MRARPQLGNRYRRGTQPVLSQSPTPRSPALTFTFAVSLAGIRDDNGSSDVPGSVLTGAPERHSAGGEMGTGHDSDTSSTSSSSSCPNVSCVASAAPAPSASSASFDG